MLGFEKPRSSRRSPRPNFVKRIYSKLMRLLQDLIRNFKRNPIKVFTLVLLPLITGGALTGMLKHFGIRLPMGLDKMFSGGGGGRTIGRDAHGELRWERTRVEESVDGFGGGGSAMDGLGKVIGGLGGVSGMVGLAKMFM